MQTHPKVPVPGQARFAAWLALIFAAALPAFAQSWNTASGGDWNTGANWSSGTPPATGSNVNLTLAGTYTVTYTSPMASDSIASLTLGGASITPTLTITAAGFNNVGACTFVDSAAEVINVNNGGVMTNNSISMGSRACVVNVNTGGALTNNTTSVAANSSNDGACTFKVNGGTASLGNVTVGRHSNSTGNGLQVVSGTVFANGVDVGTKNSYATMNVSGGSVSVINNLRLGTGTQTAGRQAQYIQSGGTVTCGGTVDMAVTNYTTYFNISGNSAVFSAAGVRIFPNTTYSSSPTAKLTNAGALYLGASGINYLNSGSYTVQLMDQSTLGASADWSGNVNLTLNTGTSTIQAADSGGTAHNITLSGTLGGSGNLVKSGAGTLALLGNNTYSANTTINAGTLVLSNTAALASSQITVASGAIFDVSGLAAGYALAAGRTLGGAGTVTGAVTCAASAIINPAGTLTFANDLTETNSAINHFDLVSDPASSANDSITVNGNLNVSGTNIIEVAGTPSVPAAYRLFHYAGAFNGDLTNFSVAGGTLSNSVTDKTIYYVIASPIRSATSVVWAGSAANSDWDTLTHSNWLNGAHTDYFVNGDTVRFDDSGGIYPNVNIAGNVSPSGVTVDSRSNYVFSGTFGIGGVGGLTKTNSGQLTITSTNTYTGVTTVNDSTLAVAQLANGGLPSAVGASASASANLVLSNATLQYLGSSASVNRGATLAGPSSIEITNPASTLTVSGVITGGGALTKNGPGALTLATDNTYAGGTVINNGTLTLNTVNAANTAGITLNGGTVRYGTLLTIPNNFNFAGNCSVDMNNLGGNANMDGTWSGGATVSVVNLITGSTLTANGSLSGFNGTLSLAASAGTFRFNSGGSGNPATGSPSASFDLGTGSATIAARNGGVTIDLGDLTGGPGTKLSGRLTGTASTLTYSVGAKNTSTTFNGTIQDGGNSTAIIKVGTGNWTLTGTSPFTGATAINAGTLTINGVNSASPVTVNAGGTLAGTGRAAAVSVVDGGTLAPGGGSIGTFTVASLTLTPAATNVFDINTATTNDIVQVNGALTPGGGKIVVNVTGGTLPVGNYRLFNYTGAKTGTFDTNIIFNGAAASTVHISEATPNQINLAVNAPPVAGNDTVLRVSGQPLTIQISSLLANDSDPNGDTVSIASVASATAGGKPITSDSTTITLVADTVNDSFTYTITDGYGGTSTATVSVNIFTPFASGLGNVVSTGGVASVTFPVVGGLNYNIQRATNVLFTAGVSNFPAVTIPSGSNTLNVLDDFSDVGGWPAQAFYRLHYNP